LRPYPYVPRQNLAFKTSVCDPSRGNLHELRADIHKGFGSDCRTYAFHHGKVPFHEHFIDGKKGLQAGIVGKTSQKEASFFHRNGGWN
jgi:hypothetical protein